MSIGASWCRHSLFLRAAHIESAQAAHIEQTVKVCISNRASDISIKKSICRSGSICLRLDVPFLLDMSLRDKKPHPSRFA